MFSFRNLGLLLKVMWLWFAFQMLPDQANSSELPGKLSQEDTERPSSHERETGILGNEVSYSGFPIRTMIKLTCKRSLKTYGHVRVINVLLYL